MNLCIKTLLLPTLFAALTGAVSTSAETSAEVEARFADPSAEYSSAPLYVWNDMLTDTQIVDTLRDLSSQGIKQAFVHPRPGLMTPYLSDQWFALWKTALAEAERLGMRLWIYDENSYPSGFAGGFVPEAMPESRGRGIGFVEMKKPPRPDMTGVVPAAPAERGGREMKAPNAKNIIAVYSLNKGKFADVTGDIKSGKAPAAPTFLAATLVRVGNSPWYGGKCYVDLLYPGVTQKFLDITFEPYRKRFGDKFGKTILGAFTDEPQAYSAGILPWTDDLPKVFEKRWGYSLIDQLPCLVRPIGDWRRVRHNYFQTVNDLFVERWAKPYSEYCARHGIEMTGHYWEHSWPDCLNVPDNMAAYAWSQRPGIDLLMNQYTEDTARSETQFGNIRIVKELASVANQMGAKRTLCETYGASGWDLRFQDQKRIEDWIYALGVNTLDQHLSYVSIRGARKRDHPLSFSYHEPWWKAYHVRADYTSRLSAALSSGSQVNTILLLEPTTSAWMYQVRGGGRKGAQGPTQRDILIDIGKRFTQLVLDLERAQTEYDLGSEDLVARHGSVDGKKFRVGKRDYSVIVLPPMMENLNAQTANLLKKFLHNGGQVFCCGEPPTLVDGQSDKSLAELVQSAGWKKIEPAEAASVLKPLGENGLTIQRAESDKGILVHHRRRLADGELLFLANTSLEAPTAGTVISAAASGAEIWDLYTGKHLPCVFDKKAEGIELGFDLPPTGSALYFLSKTPRTPAAKSSGDAVALAPLSSPAIQPLAPNVLTIDYVDLVCGGQTLKGQYHYAANQAAVKQHGLPYNPWDSAVQFRDEFITKTFPKDSGFTATYRFTIEGAVPKTLWAVVERPDLYKAKLNGKPLTAIPGEWWLDKAFGKIAIDRFARTGENELSLQASPYTVFHEIEPVYILGDFALNPVASGFVIAPPKAMGLGPWNAQGRPLYSDAVAYTERFDVPAGKGRFVVSAPDWYGSVARVTVNGKEAGHIEAPPWELDVTESIRPGENKIEVAVYGTLKNTLGPHHGSPELGSVWPASFQGAPPSGPPPGAQYQNIGYGLNKPFSLKHMPD